MKKQPNNMKWRHYILALYSFLPCFGFSQPDSFIVVGIHPAAVLQSSTIGKQLLSLFPWNDKLYAGYGDYGANTGPIDIYAFSPDSLAFIYEGQANTEAVYNYRALNGQLFAPAIDRKSYGIPGDYAKMDSSGTWANYNFGSNSTHVFDAVKLNDSVLFMTGSQDEKAAVWRSINNGKTWGKILTDTAISQIANDFARFYFGGLYNGKLYVQARDYYGSLHPASKVYDGLGWTEGPSLFPPGSGSLGWRPEVFAGRLLYRSWQPGQSSRLRSFDGLNNAWVDSLYVYDFFIDSTYFYALVDSGYGARNLRRTSDLINWENLLKVPNSSLSMAILKDRLYLGTVDSKILAYTKPVSLLHTSSVQMVFPEKIKINIYPNPARDAFSIDCTALQTRKIKIGFLNTTGSILFNQIFDRDKTPVIIITTSNYPAGVYYIKVEFDGMVRTEKIILH
ncbi:MAG: T9SS type A sorting domain-containing protein [Saprospiraceae bacterium]|nr:T9SS type A sorting domain-containing protein [Saprospiraceae bacterium]